MLQLLLIVWAILTVTIAIAATVFMRVPRVRLWCIGAIPVWPVVFYCSMPLFAACGMAVTAIYLDRSLNVDSARSSTATE